ncbi:MAG TPA: CBS domain-containing protein [Planctomycetota bacterium]
MNQAIKDIMTREVECATPDMTIREAAEIMKAKDIGSLPVCEGRKVAGILTDRDITIRAVAAGRDPNSTKAGEIMSGQIVTVREDSDVKEAERLMHDHQLRRLPAVNARGELVGYLAIAKIAREESPERTGRVLKGVSQSSRPAPMEPAAKRPKRKTG